ncbi:MAG: CPBP family intramembrane metalloprotease [Spirochaetes bacterium]|nr:CPBP family intramembrane metalloprotease [Spirochaetota bacterium]
MKGNAARTPGAAVSLLFALAALALLVPLFVTRGIPPLDFWWWMSGSLALLTAAGMAADGEFRRRCIADIESRPAAKVLAGLASAAALYALFAAGNAVSRLIFDFAAGNIDSVYGFRGGASPWRIAALMTIAIGPCEELFWRVFLQHRLVLRYGGISGLVAATVLYTAVHLAGGNLMLVMAALVCGIFWGVLYLRFRSPLLNVVSHTAWDIAVFFLFPFTG